MLYIISNSLFLTRLGLTCIDNNFGLSVVSLTNLESGLFLKKEKATPYRLVPVTHLNDHVPLLSLSD